MHEQLRVTRDVYVLEKNPAKNNEPGAGQETMRQQAGYDCSMNR